MNRLTLVLPPVDQINVSTGWSLPTGKLRLPNKKGVAVLLKDSNKVEWVTNVVMVVGVE
jgi:hypothetical protein